MSQTTSDPDQIERDLDQTRSRLGSHLEELQDRLSPGQVLDDMMAYFRTSQGGEVSGALMENIRTNPMPAAITGIGLVWLMATTSRAPTSTNSSSVRTSYVGDGHEAMMARLREAEQGVTRSSDDTDVSYSDRLYAARGQAMGLARHTQETTEAFTQRVSDAISGAQEAVARVAKNLGGQIGDKAGAMGDTLGSLGSSAQDTLRGAAASASGLFSQGGDATGRLSKAIADSPVMLGALGLAAGALLGALLPRTEQEEAVLGGAAGQLREAASNLGQQAMQSGQNVANAVADKAREGAGHITEGKTPGQLVDAALSGDLASGAKDAVKDVLRTTDETVRREAGVKSNEPRANAPEHRSGV